MTMNSLFLSLLSLLLSGAALVDAQNPCVTAQQELGFCQLGRPECPVGTSCIVPSQEVVDCANVEEECSYIRTDCCPECENQLVAAYRDCTACTDLDCEGVATISVPPRPLTDCQVAQSEYTNCLINNFANLECQACVLSDADLDISTINVNTTCDVLEQGLCKEDCCDECKESLGNFLNECFFSNPSFNDCGCDFTPSDPSAPTATPPIDPPVFASCLTNEFLTYQACMIENPDCQAGCDALADSFGTITNTSSTFTCSDAAPVCNLSASCCPACHDALDQTVGCLGRAFVGDACNSCLAAEKDVASGTDGDSTDGGSSAAATTTGLVWSRAMGVVGLLAGLLVAF